MKALRTLWVLWAVLMGCGCIDRPWSEHPLNQLEVSTTASVCVNLPPKTRPQAIEAVKAWDRAVRHWRHLVVAPAGTTECAYRIDETTKTSPDSPTAVAWVPSIGGRQIYVRIGHYETQTTAIVMHEFGHAFGAQHIDFTLMHPDVGLSQLACPDVQTVAQVAAYNHLDLKTLNWCL